jgi:anionic cell wall polymer biosynthesis LytR-Cps2A-Psr (LCP) family protein
LTTVSGNVETNFQMEDYELLLKNNYLEATKSIQQEELSGFDEIMDEIYYHFVEDEEFYRVESLLKKELEI